MSRFTRPRWRGDGRSQTIQPRRGSVGLFADPSRPVRTPVQSIIERLESRALLAPLPPSTPDMTAATDLGISSSDNITNDNTPEFTGTTQAGTKVQIYSDGVPLKAVHAPQGSYDIVAPRINDGKDNITATATGKKGTSAPSPALPIIIDTQSPTTPATVYDGPVTGVETAYTNSATTLSANWTAATDTLSGVAGYQYAIGTSAGGTQGLGYTDAGNVTSVTRAGLSLTNGTKYYVSVRAYDAVGNISSSRSSSGVTVDTVAPVITAVAAAPSPFSPNGDGVKDAAAISYTITDASPTTVTVSLYEAANNLVRSLAGGGTGVTWDGRDSSGAVVADGAYTFRVDACWFQRYLGSPALSMIQALQEGGDAAISREFAVGPGRKSAIIIENAGDPI